MPATPLHATIASRLDRRLGTFAEAHRLGDSRVEAAYWTRPGHAAMRGPDVSFISRERAARETVHLGASEAAPELAVEVVSRYDRFGDVFGKVEEYLEAGVERAWLVVPGSRAVIVFRNDGTARIARGESVLTSDDAAFAVPGFELRVADLFPEEMPAEETAPVEQPPLA